MGKKYYHNGKRASLGEIDIAKFLEYNNIEYIREYSFNDCLSEKGNPLRFDFYIPQFLLLIEHQGQHHYKPVNKYRRAKKVHDQTVKHDIIKKDYCNKNNIKLLEINIKDRKNIFQILVDYFNTNFNKE